MNKDSPAPCGHGPDAENANTVLAVMSSKPVLLSIGKNSSFLPENPLVRIVLFW
jgi:hypothetical protein